MALAHPALARPRRIVSIDLCADQYLLALADPAQIAGLSQFARDPALSFSYARARAFRPVRGTAEDILPLKPDLVLGSPSHGYQTRALLRRFGVRVIGMGLVHDFAGIVAETRRIAAAIGQPARGAALIARMRAALATVPPPAGRAPLAVHYQRRGYVTGPGTLMDDIMRRAGLDNLAGRLRTGALAHVDLETILVSRPDYIVLTTDPARARDWGALLLHHPALAQGFRGRMLYIPDRLTVCGGPSYPAAVLRLAAQLRAHGG